MKFKFLSKISMLAFVLYGSVTQAALIESDYTTVGDNLAVYDNVSDLTWLDLSVTSGLGYSEVDSLFSNWRHATSTEVRDLFNSVFPSVTYGLLGSANISDPINTLAAESFATLFGDSDNSSEAFHSGFYKDSGGTLRSAGVYSFAPLRPIVFGPDYTLSFDSFENSGHQSYGQFLVQTQTSRQALAQVSEPSIFAIFALGLIGLGLRRFKK